MNILQLTVHFSPNLGGVETHLDDLATELVNKNNYVFVLAYRPLSVKTRWKMWEKKSHLQILRIPWIPGFFNRLAVHPILEFLYLSVGLLIVLPFVLIGFRPRVIHAHGLIAGFVGIIWGKIFGIRIIISTHSIYTFPKKGLYRQVAKFVFQMADMNLCLSNQSKNELIKLGVPSTKIDRFTYWVDLKKFKPLPKKESKVKLGWEDKFTVLFVGRLVAEKGIPELLSASKLFNKNVKLKIAGSGPLEYAVKDYYVGRISQDRLPVYYSAADVVVVPSTHEEGFGRVIIESLACGTPVIAANRGAIPEAMNETVGKLITINPKSISRTVNEFAKDSNGLNKYSTKARIYAQGKYSKNNIEKIIDFYI